MSKYKFLIFIVSLFFAVAAHAQPKKPPKLTRILFIFDGSNSMHGKWGNTKKIDIAKEMLIKLVDSLEHEKNLQLALRIYGHQSPFPPPDCSDSKLEVPFKAGNAGMIRQKLRWMSPKGTTPIARSLELSGNDFPHDPTARNIIILITDGLEACNGDPCAVAASLRKKGIMLKPFVIGIGLDENLEKSFGCLGRVFNAKVASQFKAALDMAIAQATTATTCQINLLDSFNKPTETNVTINFYDQISGKLTDSYIHTINYKGHPDTIKLDPLITYKMVAQTLPPVTINNIVPIHNKHSVFKVKAPQGYLQLMKPMGTEHKDLQMIVKKSGSSVLVNAQAIGKAEKYICGRYDVEILSLPRIRHFNIEIKQSKTKVLKIEQPGQVTFLKKAAGFGGVYVHRPTGLEFVVNLNPAINGSETFQLQPGKYTVVYRAKNAKNVLYSIERHFTVRSGVPTHVKIN